ncbi:MAG: ISNCY family transposase [Gemmatimonadota bacterium]
MSRKEISRGSVLARVAAGTLTLTDAVPLLGVSYRQAKRIWRRYRAHGAKALVHGNVGRPSNRACAATERAAVLALIRAHYSGPLAKGPGQRFGPTLVAEHLWIDHAMLVARSTLRDWMRDAGLWSRVRRSRPTKVRRERKAHFGELLQLDGSFHDWFEGRGERAGKRSCMMALVDDATSTTLLQFGAEETTWAAVALLRAWIDAHGVPRALYTDWKNVYKREPTVNERARGDTPYTAFGRMCQKLDIAIIGAASPQAKGRVERSHGTQQDRLIKKMRLRGISDDTAANAYLGATYLPTHNARFAVAPASAVDHHRARDRRLRDDDVFCLEETRVVGQDYVVQYQGQGLQLDRAARGRVPAKSQVLVRETVDQRVRVIHVGRDGRERVCAWTPAIARAPVARPIAPPIVDAPPVAAFRPPSRPAPDHPWRLYPVTRQPRDRRPVDHQP